MGRLIARRGNGRPLHIPKPWGHELLFARTGDYVGKILYIRKGRRLSLQYHRRKEETVLLVRGLLRLTHGPSTARLRVTTLKPGQVFHVSPRLIHRFEALRTCTLFEVSTTQLDDVVRLSDDYGREAR